jgi:DNA polymerase elongation subunit (family B)
MYSNDLIFGKDKTERIVSIEPNDDLLEIFIRDKDGNVRSEFKPNCYWVLTDSEIPGNRHIKLDGNLHYKYAKTFDNRIDYFRYKQFAKSKFLSCYSVSDPKEAIMMKEGYTYFKGMTPKELSIFSFDLETTGLVHDDTSKILCISITYRDSAGQTNKYLIDHKKFPDQGSMLKDFNTILQSCNPDVLIGHSILMFDIPYMQYIADNEGISLDWGRNKSAIRTDNHESKFRKDGSQFYHYHKVHCYGREICDTLFLTIKHDATDRKLESYGLKPVIKQLGFEKKDRVFYDASKIRENYTIPEEWEKIKAYCMDDSDDPIVLFDHMVVPLFYATQSIPKSFQSVVESATGSQINSIMVRAYLQQKHSIPKAEESSSYEGGISIGNPGVYRNVWKVDVRSLYPSIILQYKIEIEIKTLMDIFLKWLRYLLRRDLRIKLYLKETKNPYYDGLQSAQKIFINSAYGFLGTGGLNFNSPDLAALVTEYGRDILRKAIKWAGDFNFTLVNADTDSISISLDGRELSEGERKFYLTSLNILYPDKIRFADDGYYETVIILKAKNYVLKKKGAKPTYKGSAIKATLKEPRLKNFIKDIIREIGLGRGEYLNCYNSFVREIMSITDITGWCTKKTITEKVLNGKRANETKVMDAIAGTEYREGDKIYTYFRSDKTIGLRENFDGDYSKNALLKKLFDTAEIFDTVIDVNIFPNYSLKKNKKALQELLNETNTTT